MNKIRQLFRWFKKRVERAATNQATARLLFIANMCLSFYLVVLSIYIDEWFAAGMAVLNILFQFSANMHRNAHREVHQTNSDMVKIMIEQQLENEDLQNVCRDLINQVVELKVALSLYDPQKEQNDEPANG